MGYSGTENVNCWLHRAFCFLVSHVPFFFSFIIRLELSAWRQTVCKLSQRTSGRCRSEHVSEFAGLRNTEIIKFSFQHVFHDSLNTRTPLSRKENATERQWRTQDDGKTTGLYFLIEPRCNNNDHNYSPKYQQWNRKTLRLLSHSQQ